MQQAFATGSHVRAPLVLSHPSACLRWPAAVGLRRGLRLGMVLGLAGILGLVGILGLAMVPANALALEDGGGRSVFAYGAGNRALALGGAYAAVADDASAAIWNPGGLGWVPRKQIQLTHTNLIGLGFSEQYASVVLPSWRLGTASLTFRRFGVDGIDERDDRNVLLSDDLSNNESEIMLAYGHGLGSAWSIGGAVKLQNQKLAGVSASGVGLDLGLMVRPLQAAGVNTAAEQTWAVGLAIRNAIEPSLRLNEEPVPDPTGVRLGTAYSHPLADKLHVLGSLDIEKTQDMDTRLHAGIELAYQSLLALRFGMDAGVFMAGTAVRWHDVGVDYTYEDNPIESVHRIGLSFTFGPTTAASREAHFAAEEEELQSRLNQAFEVQNQTRVTQILNRARRAIAAQQYDDALELLAMVEVLSPSEPGIRALNASAYRGRGLAAAAAGNYAEATVDLGRALSLQPQDRTTAAELQRIRAESDLQATRSEEIRELLDTALDAFAAGDLLQAQEGFQRVLQVDPEDQDALDMLRRTEGTIQQTATNLVKQSRTLVQAGQLTEAASALGQAVALDPDVPGVAEVRNLMAKTRRAQEQAARQAARSQVEPDTSLPVTAPPPAPAPRYSQLSEEERREMAVLYRRGMEAAEQGRNGDAVRYWELVWSSDPSYQRVAEYLKREYLARGMEYFAEGRLQEAVADWQDALKIDPSDERALGYLERAQQQQLRIERIVDES